MGDKEHDLEALRKFSDGPLVDVIDKLTQAKERIDSTSPDPSAYPPGARSASDTHERALSETSNSFGEAMEVTVRTLKNLKKSIDNLDKVEKHNKGGSDQIETQL